jgi:hypothetical protein
LQRQWKFNPADKLPERIVQVMRRILASLLLWTIIAQAGLAAADGPEGAKAGRKENRPMPPFISPAGKPYRSDAGEPYAKAEWFASLDIDQNGEVSAADFVAEAEAFFNELDTDADGRIALSEITHYEKVVAPEVQAGYRPPGVDGMRGTAAGHGRRP